MMEEGSSIENDSHFSHQSMKGDVCVIRLGIVSEGPIFSHYGRCHYYFETLFDAWIPHDSHQLRLPSHSPNMLDSHHLYGETSRALTSPRYCSLTGIS